jgi:WD40 repeat protein
MSPVHVPSLPADGGTWLVAAADSVKVTVWDLDAGNILTKFKAGHSGLNSLAFSPDGTILALGGRGRVELLDIATGEHLLDIEDDFVTGLEFSPDGMSIAIGTDLKYNGVATVSIWRLEFGRGISTLRGLSARVERACFSPDSRLIAGFSHDWELGLWEMASGQLVRVCETPHGGYPDNANVTFSPDGQRLVFAGENAARMWDVASGKVLASWELPFGLFNIHRFTANDLTLVRVEDKACRIYQLLPPDRTNVLAVISEFTGGVLGVAASPEGKSLVVEGLPAVGQETGSQGHLIKRFDSRTGVSLWIKPNTGSGALLTTDPGGRLLAFWSDQEHEALLVDLFSGRELQKWPWLPYAISPGATLCAKPTDTERGFSLYSQLAAKPLITLAIDTQPAKWPEFDSTGNLLAWGNLDGTVTVCNLSEINQRLTKIGLGW